MKQNGCVTIKQRELDALYKKISDLEKEESEKITNLKKELVEVKKDLSEEQEKKKPDYVEAQVTFHTSTSYGWYNQGPKYEYDTRVNIKTNLNLSSGIHRQLKGLLTESKSVVKEYYLHKFYNEGFREGFREGFNRALFQAIDKLQNGLFISKLSTKLVSNIKLEDRWLKK